MPRRYYSRRRRVPRKYPGNSRRFTRSSGRETPYYTYSRVSKKLVHVHPIPSTVQSTYANSGDTNNNSIHLNDISLGNGIHQRSSNRIFMRNLVLNLAVDFDPMDNIHHATIRFVLVYDKECRGGARPLTTDILDQADPMSMPRIETRDRFDILWMYDWRYDRAPVWNGTAIVYGGGNGEGIHRFIIPVNRSTVYEVSASTGFYSDTMRGGLVLYCVLARPFNATTNPRVYYTVRLTYDDIV